MKKITLLSLLFFGHLSAQIINTAPYILTVDELKQWTLNGPTASQDLVATVPLAERFTNAATQFNPALTNDMQIAYLPDGMNNFGNYHGEQSQFNLYNFTHWAYLDKFIWFGGTSSQSIQIPSSPWANAAHKNGVKIFGNVFFAPTAFGGSTTTLQNFLEKDTDGHFIAIPKMIEIMQYYNFDGWFINQETATNSTVAGLMYEFVRDLTAQAEATGKEVMWYDAMVLSGSVGWQNRLNANNSVFVQRDADGDTANGFETRVSSSIFINFFWGSSSLPTMSRNRAAVIGRSSYDVFTGADIWPGRNQGNFATNGNQFMGYLHENATTPYTSLGLFAPNCIYNNSIYTNFNNDPTDYATFYSAENHMFGGQDRNPALTDATGFKGFCNWVPETSVIMGPFSSHFNTGHGIKKFTAGALTSSNSWHDMNQQDILPTWQWAFSQDGPLSGQWDFDDAFNGGSSLRVSGNIPANTPIDLMLYKTKIPVVSNIGSTKINLIYKSGIPDDPKMKLIVVFADEVSQKYEFPLTNSITINGWRSVETMLDNFIGREIAMIGVRFATENGLTAYTINIGSLSVEDNALHTSVPVKNNDFVTVSYPGNNGVLFTVSWPNASRINYTVYDLQGKVIKADTIQLDQTTSYQMPANGMASGTYMVRFSDQYNTVITRKIIVR